MPNLTLNLYNRMEDKTKNPLDYFTDDSFMGGGVDLEFTDVPVVEEEVVDEEVQEEIEEEVETHQEDVVEPEGESEEEPVEAEGATKAYFFAKEFVEDGTLPEGFEFDENITGQELKAALLEEATGGFDPATYAKAEGYTDEVFRIAESLVSGIPPSLLYEYQRYRYIANIDLDKDEVIDQILLEYYKDKGIDESSAQDLITSKIERGTEVEEAEEAQKYFLKKAEALDEEEKKKIEARKANIQKAKDDIIQKIKTGISGLKIDKKESQNLIDYLYKETEVQETVIDGKKHRRMVSKFKKDYDADTSDPERFIRYAYNRMKGFDIEKIKESTTVEAAMRHIDALNERTKSRSTDKKSKKREVVDLYSGFSQLM